MRILLINPSLYQANTGHYEKEVEKERGVYPPLGLAYIAAILEKNGHEVKIVDCDAEENHREAINKLCFELKPQLVGFYAMTWNYSLANEINNEIKKINPEIISVLGGPNVTTMPEASLKYGNFDFGVLGEGEQTITELIENLEQQQETNFEKILGLAFKKNGEIIVNPFRPLIANLDEIPFPARHLLKMDRYSDVFSRQQKFATIIATRGCPFNCTFCDRKNRMGKNWRYRSVANIIQEIKEVIEKYDIHEFMFFDDNLIVNKNWAYELMSELKKLNIIWECRERVDMVDEQILKAMKEAGCYRIRFGFESGDNSILKNLKKDITVEQSLECAKLCQKIGIEIFSYFIIGAPGESRETAGKTISLALKINPSFAAFSKMILIPGSEIFQYAASTGQIETDYWEQFITGVKQNGAPSFTKERLSEEEVDNLVKLADRKFYFRPAYILRKILEVRSFDHFISQAKMGLALILKSKKNK